MWDERDVIPARRGEEQFALVRTKPEDIRRIRELEQAYAYHGSESAEMGPGTGALYPV